MVSMEMGFILAGLQIIILSIPLGFLVEWLFRNENEEDEDVKAD